MWGFGHCPHQLLRVVGHPTTNWKRKPWGCSEGSKLLSANQTLPAPPPVLFPSLPSATQSKATSQVFGLRFDWEHLVGSRTCPGSLGQQDPLIKAAKFTDHQGRNETCSDCSCAKIP